MTAPSSNIQSNKKPTEMINKETPYKFYSKKIIFEKCPGIERLLIGGKYEPSDWWKGLTQKEIYDILVESDDFVKCFD